MYSVNWQRDIEIRLLDGKKVVIKRNQRYKTFHELVIVFVYAILSIILLHPTNPPLLGKKIMYNEGYEIRNKLKKFGISTPKLIKISESEIIEEYFELGDLYRYLYNLKDISLVYKAGEITGRLHKSKFVFIDNRAQNYLISKELSLVRTDLAFIQKSTSIFSRSMDIASFLSSLFDFEKETYARIEDTFFDGYYSEYGHKFPYLSIILRNILSLGFNSNPLMIIINMLLNSTSKIGI